MACLANDPLNDDALSQTSTGVFSPDEGGVKASQLTREAWMNPNAGQDWKYASITRSWARTASHETKSFSESSLILSNFGLNFC